MIEYFNWIPDVEHTMTARLEDDEEFGGMMEHTCPAAVITCIDFRFWQKLLDYMATRGETSFDLISMAGGAKNLIDNETRPVIFKQLDICTQKHCIKKVYLVNHIDCGAYGGSAAFASREEEEEKLIGDLGKAENFIKEKYPDLEVEKLLMDFEEIRDLGSGS